MSGFNLADLFESVVAAVPEREAIVTEGRRLSYRDLDDRANRLAGFLRERGIGAGDHIGLQLTNGSEYIEGMLAAFKLRAVPINVNYRYVAGELHHLFDDAELRALILHRSFQPNVTEVLESLPKLETLLVVEDGSNQGDPIRGSFDYETAVERAPVGAEAVERSGDDHYIVYTGGTTGLPKGVVWRHEDIFFGAMGGGDPMQLGRVITDPDELASRIPDAPIVALPTAPFMHAAAQWLAFNVLFGGGKLVLPEKGAFDPDEIWNLVDSEGVTLMVIVGDAMATPLSDALEKKIDSVDVSGLAAIASGGALFSPAVKQRLGAILDGCLLIDGLGSSETGTLGNQADASETSAGPRFRVNEQTAVLDEALKPVAPGVVGRLARRGHIPIGYWQDEVKSAATFAVVDGERWALPGDMATVEEDGTIMLLGRGSSSINTGGEKVFPEEVEATLKAHPRIEDAVVVGASDEKWGQRVVAVVQARNDAVLELAEIKSFCEDRIARYKIPRELVLVDRVVRSPAGKPDYPWARALVQGED